MKKLVRVSIIAIALVTFISCKNEKKEVKQEAKKPTVVYVVNPNATKIAWTAYKTTAKKAVKGVFKTINFDKKEGATAKEALNNLEFSIPVSSIFSGNEERDGKLVASFFGAMLDTEFLSGKLVFAENNTCNAEITMNGKTQTIPFAYTENEGTFVFDGVMNLEKWDALGAIEALNKVCFDLHKGDDGISKTWNDVAIKIETVVTVK